MKSGAVGPSIWGGGSVASVVLEAAVWSVASTVSVVSVVDDEDEAFDVDVAPVASTVSVVSVVDDEDEASDVDVAPVVEEETGSAFSGVEPSAAQAAEAIMTAISNALRTIHRRIVLPVCCSNSVRNLPHNTIIPRVSSRIVHKTVSGSWFRSGAIRSPLSTACGARLLRTVLAGSNQREVNTLGDKSVAGGDCRQHRSELMERNLHRFAAPFAHEVLMI